MSVGSQPPQTTRIAGEEEAVVITHEDVDRAHDRVRVSAARAQRGFFSGARLLWLLVGPGVLVMLGENDGPSMLSYAATGAKFGIGFFIPFVAITFCMAIVVQEMTVRLGAATHRGHAELIFDRFDDVMGQASGLADFILVDTPGADTALSRKAHQSADVIVTPLNDSFVDFDMLGHVDPVTLELQKPSLYSESVWEARKVRALALRHALSSKAKDGALVVLEEAVLKAPKTAALRAHFEKLGLSNALLVDGTEIAADVRNAARNIPNIDMLPVVGINVYDVMRRRKLVLTRAAVEALEARFK